MKSGMFIVCWRAIALLCLIITLGCRRATSAPPTTAKAGITPLGSGNVSLTARATSLGQVITTVPHPDHVVIVIEENHAYSDIIGSSSAPYINALASHGAVLTNSYAVTHPSEPNYLALFAGSTFGISDDSCPHTFTDANLAQELMQAHDSFGGYAEDLPNIGYTGCQFSNYVRKHNPWVNFTNVPARVNMPFSKFPTDFSSLPTVSIVVPNLQNDMHDGTVEEADAWLKNHIGSYAKWAKENRSLLIVTWDEDDRSSANHIPIIFVGPMVKIGKYSENINHYSVLRTLYAIYGLAYNNKNASIAIITDIWQVK